MKLIIKVLVVFVIVTVASLGFATNESGNECEPCEAGDVPCGGESESDNMPIKLKD